MWPGLQLYVTVDPKVVVVYMGGLPLAGAAGGVPQSTTAAGAVKSVKEAETIVTASNGDLGVRFSEKNETAWVIYF